MNPSVPKTVSKLFEQDLFNFLWRRSQPRGTSRIRAGQRAFREIPLHTPPHESPGRSGAPIEVACQLQRFGRDVQALCRRFQQLTLRKIHDSQVPSAAIATKCNGCDIVSMLLPKRWSNFRFGTDFVDSTQAHDELLNLALCVREGVHESSPQGPS